MDIIRDDSSESSDVSIQSWIDWFCSLPGHEYYLAVPEEFIEDEFNLTGLSTVIPYYRQALEIILDCEDDAEEKVDPTIIEPYTFMLYGLIHQRYLLTANGIGVMAEKYSNGQFGRCPRYYCSQCFVLPVGRFDEVGKESVCLYCPLCLDIYYPSSSIYQRVDGAHFGSSYSHLLFLIYPELRPKLNSYIYQPRIFGFRVNELSPAGPRNQWLRIRYEQEEEESVARQIQDLHVSEPSSSLSSFFQRWI